MREVPVVIEETEEIETEETEVVTEGIEEAEEIEEAAMTEAVTEMTPQEAVIVEILQEVEQDNTDRSQSTLFSNLKSQEITEMK